MNVDVSGREQRTIRNTGWKAGAAFQGFTLIELLVTITIVALLSALTVGSWNFFRGISTRSVCSNNLRQLCAATNLYVADNNGFFPSYLKAAPGGRMWWFGLETSSGGSAEGSRDLDVTKGPLYPYIDEVGKVEVCGAFNYNSALWKPKFKGASYGYGYNWILGGRIGGMPMHVGTLRSGAGVILYADCGQVNTFQAPASSSNPLIEEFYLINETDNTIHFRHNGRANILFVDGHVESFKPYPGTENTTVRGETTGRITPKGSMDMLR